MNYHGNDKIRPSSGINHDNRQANIYVCIYIYIFKIRKATTNQITDKTSLDTSTEKKKCRNSNFNEI